MCMYVCTCAIDVCERSRPQIATTKHKQKKKLSLLVGSSNFKYVCMYVPMYDCV